MNTGLLGLLLGFSISLFISESIAQECPSTGSIKKIDNSGQSIELSLESFSKEVEVNIYDSDNRVYIYSESKLDPGFYIQEDLAVTRVGYKIQITGFEVPYSVDRYRIIVRTEDCKAVALVIMD